MVAPDMQSANQAVQNARQALRQGDQEAARRWAQRAVTLAPNLEDAWLVLAAVSDPQASLRCLQRALKINPNSQRARAGLQWAARRLQRNGAAPDSPATAAPASRRPRALQSRPPAPTTPARKGMSMRRVFLPILLVTFCLVLAVSAWFGASPAMAFLRASASTPTIVEQHQSWAQVDVEKPTYTPSPTATFTPTPTDSPTPTPTDTPTPTPTDTPTNTPEPTNTPLPYKSPVPAPTQAPPTSAPRASSGGTHWLEVNLTQQRLYAYEGDTLVRSFVVSTGTWQHPTVTGNYRIYIKQRYDNMAGPGYYLPDVPYTMYFYKGYAIHGTYWHNNFGTPMSHGCVNLSIPDAEWVYNFSSIGTLVYVHY